MDTGHTGQDSKTTHRKHDKFNQLSQPQQILTLAHTPRKEQKLQILPYLKTQ